MVSTRNLDHYRDQFADALYSSDRHEGAAGLMESSLDDAIRLYNGDVSHVRRWDETLEEKANFWEQESEREGESDQQQAEGQLEPTDRKSAAFRNLQRQWARLALGVHFVRTRQVEPDSHHLNADAFPVKQPGLAGTLQGVHPGTLQPLVRAWLERPAKVEAVTGNSPRLLPYGLGLVIGIDPMSRSWLASVGTPIDGFQAHQPHQPSNLASAH